MNAVLVKRFFRRPALVVAEELIGCFLCRKIRGKVIRLCITETEAYDGPRDKASHAHRGRTSRNAPMWGRAGYWYIYFTYGMHWMLNVVTGPKGYPAAALIRGAGKIEGPARLTKFLNVDKAQNGKPAAPETGLWVERLRKTPFMKIARLPRVGVAYAGPVWAKKLYRFKAAAPSDGGIGRKRK